MYKNKIQIFRQS